jgi:KUP system potassium uptake protein
VFVEDVRMNPPHRVKGTAVFMSGNPDGTPLALLHNLKHNRILHERTVLLTITTMDSAHVPAGQRVEVKELGLGLYRVCAKYGFMDEPAIAVVLESCAVHGLDLKVLETTFFLSRETIIPAGGRGAGRWRRALFALLSRNAQSATAYFRLPANRVVELGMQVEL